MQGSIDIWDLRRHHIIFHCISNRNGLTVEQWCNGMLDILDTQTSIITQYNLVGQWRSVSSGKVTITDRMHHTQWYSHL